MNGWTEKTYNRVADTLANMERPSRRKPLAKKKDKGRHTQNSSPCSIHIHSVRKRLCDADGISGKAAIDGLIHAGVLQDDGPQHVESVSYSQEKGAVEKTVITIEWK